MQITKRNCDEQSQAFAEVELEVQLFKNARHGSKECVADAQHNLMVAAIEASVFLDNSAASRTVLLLLARGLSDTSMETYQSALATVERQKAQAERIVARDRCESFRRLFLRFEKLMESDAYTAAEKLLLEQARQIVNGESQ